MPRSTVARSRGSAGGAGCRRRSSSRAARCRSRLRSSSCRSASRRTGRSPWPRRWRARCGADCIPAPPSPSARTVSRARVLSRGGRSRPAVPDGRALAVPARGDGTGVAGRGVGCRRQSGSHPLGRNRAPGVAARPGGVGGGPGATARGRRVLAAVGGGGSGLRAARVHARADRGPHRGGGSRGARAPATEGVRIPNMTDLLLAQGFSPMGGGIARLHRELARRYPRGELIVSTPQDPDAAEVDAQFGGAVDRLPVGRRRTKSLPGLLFWSRRAASLARQHRVQFVYCGNVKPAGYPARWVYERTHVPYGVFLYGADLLSEQHKYHSSKFKRRSARAILGGAAVYIAISNWTR